MHMNGSSTVAVEGFTEGAHEEPTVAEGKVSPISHPIWSTDAAVAEFNTQEQAKDSHKDHVTGQQFAAQTQEVK